MIETSMLVMAFYALFKLIIEIGLAIAILLLLVYAVYIATR